MFLVFHFLGGPICIWVRYALAVLVLGHALDGKPVSTCGVLKMVECLLGIREASIRPTMQGAPFEIHPIRVVKGKPVAGSQRFWDDPNFYASRRLPTDSLSTQAGKPRGPETPLKGISQQMNLKGTRFGHVPSRPLSSSTCWKYQLCGVAPKRHQSLTKANSRGAGTLREP